MTAIQQYAEVFPGAKASAAIGALHKLVPALHSWLKNMSATGGMTYRAPWASRSQFFYCFFHRESAREHGWGAPSLFSRGGTLLPSICADARYIDACALFRRPMLAGLSSWRTCNGWSI